MSLSLKTGAKLLIVDDSKEKVRFIQDAATGAPEKWKPTFLVATTRQQAEKIIADHESLLLGLVDFHLDGREWIHEGTDVIATWRKIQAERHRLHARICLQTRSSVGDDDFTESQTLAIEAGADHAISLLYTSTNNPI